VSTKWVRYKGYEDSTLDDAKSWLQDNLDDGAYCPCCGQVQKVWRRLVGAGAARDMIILYRHGGYTNPVHLARLTNGGSMAKMRFLGLVRMDEKRGFWQLTELGLAFVLGKVRVPVAVFMLNGECIGIDTTSEVTIKDALAKGFDYDSLMNGTG
jgi:hypothetical protein